MAVPQGRVKDAVSKWTKTIKARETVEKVVFVKKSKVLPPSTTAATTTTERIPSTWQYFEDGIWKDFHACTCKNLDISWINGTEITNLFEDGIEFVVSIREPPCNSGPTVIEKRVGRQKFQVRRVGIAPFKLPKKIEGNPDCRFGNEEEIKTHTWIPQINYNQQQNGSKEEIRLDMLPGEILGKIFMVACYKTASCSCHKADLDGFGMARSLCTLELVCKRFRMKDSSICGYSPVDLAALLLCSIIPIPTRNFEWSKKPHNEKGGFKEEVLWRAKQTENRSRDMEWYLHKLAFGPNSKTRTSTQQKIVKDAAMAQIIARFGAVDKSIYSNIS